MARSGWTTALPVALTLVGCGSPPPSSATAAHEPAATGPGTTERGTTEPEATEPVVPEPAPAERTPEPTSAVDPVSPADDPGGPVPCAEVAVGIDLRAYPVGTPPSDLRNLGEADDMRRALPGEPEPEMLMTPGASGFAGRFRRPPGDDALDACRRALAVYLDGAPRMPITFDSAAHVTVDCQPCEAP